MLRYGLELHLPATSDCAAHATFVCRKRVAASCRAGGTQRLPRAIPFGVAMEMILTGESIDAEAALRWGLVSRLASGNQLMECAMGIAERIAYNGRFGACGS